MSKMTDEQIKKALKVCAKNETPFCCGECELGENNSSCDCVDRLLKLSLDLINRQQEKIEYMQGEREVLLEDMQVRNNQVIEQQAEVERLKEEVALKSLKCNLLEQEKAKNISSFVDDLKLVRADAIKEFADRLKKQIFIKKDKAFYSEKIDNLVKEMVGEQE